MKKIEQHIVNKIRELRNKNLSFEKISKILNLSRETVTKYAKDIILSKEQKYEMRSKSISSYSYDISTFFSYDEISYYILGAFITDGHINYNKKTYSYSAVLTSKDFDWLNSINQYICPDKPIIKNKQFNAYLLHISNKKITEWFINNGCNPCKSLSIKFPDVPEKYLKDFIRGCFDGDGCLCIYNTKKDKKIKYYSYISSASEEFILTFKEKLKLLGIESTINKCKLCNGNINGRIIHAKNNLFRLHLNQYNSYKLAKIVYYNNCLSLSRKQCKAENIVSIYENKYNK